MSNLKGLVGLSVVKNEADVIEAMIRHNLRYLDSLIIIDNNSGDPTCSIVQALCREHPGRLFLRHDSSTGHLQQQILNQICEELSANEDIACFVPLDTDEFIRGDSGLYRATLLAETRPVLFPWVTYVPTENDDATEANPLLRIVNRRAREKPQYYKTSFPRCLVGKTQLAPGSHHVQRRRSYDCQVVDGLSLAHFPIRSKEQMWAKVVIGWLNLRMRDGDTGVEGQIWRTLHDRILETGALSDADFYDAAGNYAARRHSRLIRDPMPVAEEDRVMKYPVDNQSLIALKLTAFASECVDRLVVAQS